MAAEKVSTMILKVDLQCPFCYKKTKKTLCKFPQVRDQTYDEKSNTVTIKVVCCSPEKIRNKLCCKGGKAIKSITIQESGKPDKPKEVSEKPKQATDKPKEAADKPKEKEKPKGPEKPKVVIMDPKETGKPKVVIMDPKAAGKPKNGDKPKDMEKPKSNGKADKPKSADGGGPPPQKPADKVMEGPRPEHPKNLAGPPVMNPYPVMKGPEQAPAQGVPSIFPYVGPSYAGYAAGPYYHGYGYPTPQPIYRDGYYDYGHVPGYECGYGPGRAANGNRYESYYSDENPQGCSIM